MRVESGDLKRLARDLKGLGDGTMGKELQAKLRESAKPIVADVRAAALAIPVKGETSTRARSARAQHSFDRSKAKKKTLSRFEKKAALRQTIARAVRLNVSASGGRVAVTVDSSLLPESQRSLPWSLEGASRWRHPVFGHNRWVTQQSHPFFYQTVERHMPRITNDVEHLMDEFIAKLD